LTVSTDTKELSSFANDIYTQKYAMVKPNGQKETWPETAERVVSNVLGALNYDADSTEYKQILKLVIDRKFIPGGRYLYSAGRELHQVNNCFLVYAEDTREGWAELLKKSAMVLQTGGGLGVEYSDIRPYGSPIKKTGGIASGPVPLMQMVNEIGRGVIQGGFRRSALIALLDWSHGDIEQFIRAKDWPEAVRAAKEKDANTFAHMDRTNISVNLDDTFFEAFDHDISAQDVYYKTVEKMVSTGEPGFSINCGDAATEKLRNPCGEVCSSDDSDVCNLGSINLSRIETIAEFAEVVELATLFLLAGTVYSDIPYDKVGEVRAKNRRIGLGLMGVHEWLLRRGKPYAADEELGLWLKVYEESGWIAAQWASKHGLNNPIATRSLAPTGSIGILGETTTGIEPIFCVAYKRRYLAESEKWKYQYVVDPTANRLIEIGVDPEDIEDAYTLSYNVEKRVQFQAWIQQYVDMAVSSTINLPEPITDPVEARAFGDMLLPYLPKLRGITAYPNNARGGQPLVPSTYSEAIKHKGVVFEEDESLTCRTGVCGA
jgi:ribonucleoside-diphosphate reductase alpha chain